MSEHQVLSDVLRVTLERERGGGSSGYAFLPRLAGGGRMGQGQAGQPPVQRQQSPPVLTPAQISALPPHEQEAMISAIAASIAAWAPQAFAQQQPQPHVQQQALSQPQAQQSVPKLSLENIDAALIERVSQLTPSVTNASSYLADCFARCRSLRARETGETSHATLLALAESSILTASLHVISASAVPRGTSRSPARGHLLAFLRDIELARSLLRQALKSARERDASSDPNEAARQALGPVVEDLAYSARSAAHRDMLAEPDAAWPYPSLAECCAMLLHFRDRELLGVLGLTIVDDLERAPSSTGRQLEMESVLASFLHLSCVFVPYEQSSVNYIAKYVPEFGDEPLLVQSGGAGLNSRAIRMGVNALYERMRPLMQAPREAVHAVLKRLLAARPGEIELDATGMDSTAMSEFRQTKWTQPVLQWMATLAQLSEARVGLDPKDEMFQEMSLMVASDGFSLNFAAVLLMFCVPIVKDPSDTSVARIDAAYIENNSRLDFSKFPHCTDFNEFNAQKSVARAEEAEKNPHLDVSLAGSNASGTFSFSTDIFFITYFALHDLLLPCVDSAEHFMEILGRIRERVDGLKEQFGDTWVEATGKEGGSLALQRVRYTAVLDGLNGHLLDPELVENVARFYVFAARMVVFHVSKAAAGDSFSSSLFSRMPEFFLRDITDFMGFILRLMPGVWLGIHQLPEHVFSFVVELLAHPREAARSPILRSKLINILAHVVMRKDQEIEHGISAMATGTENIGQQLTWHLHQSERAQAVLGGGLVQLFMDVDVVEGLDVDKESFDKYSVRRVCALLLKEFWYDPVWKSNFIEFIRTHDVVWSRFVSALLSDTIHVLEDSLGRLKDIHDLEEAMKDQAAWNSQDDEIKKHRDAYYQSQKRASRGFLNLTHTMLDLVQLLGEDIATAGTFLKEDLRDRLVAMLLHAYDLLCGPSQGKLRVKDPAQYDFDPKILLKKVTTICIVYQAHDQTIREPGRQSFAAKMVEHEDYTPKVITAALRIVEKHVWDQSSRELIAFNALVSETLSLAGAIGGDAFMSDAEASRDATDVASKEEAPIVQRNFDVDSTIDMAALDRLYQEHLEDLVFDSASFSSGDPTDARSWRHHYGDNIVSHVPGTTAADRDKMTRLTKEFQTLAEQLLPLSASASVFIRTDDERLDVVKALLIGPPGTPYAGGCFEFHVYFPPNYPHDPPLVNMETTGNGTMRFNPNLYNCGKVCLSLLGTWHGGSAVEKWSATKSNLFQVFISIQGLIMIDEPYYNEPAYEAQRGTKEGDDRSFAYNELIRLGTLRHAVVGQLRQPAEGFEEVIDLHFRIQKHRILKIARQWLAESTPEFRAKMERAVHDVETELAKLETIEDGSMTDV